MDRTGPIKANWDCQATSDWRRVKVGADFLFCGWAVLRLVLFSGLSGSLSWSLYFAANGSDFLSNLCTEEEAFNPVQPFVRTYNSFLNQQACDNVRHKPWMVYWKGPSGVRLRHKKTARHTKQLQNDHNKQLQKCDQGRHKRHKINTKRYIYHKDCWRETHKDAEDWDTKQ